MRRFRASRRIGQRSAPPLSERKSAILQTDKIARSPRILFRLAARLAPSLISRASAHSSLAKSPILRTGSCRSAWSLALFRLFLTHAVRPIPLIALGCSSAAPPIARQPRIHHCPRSTTAPRAAFATTPSPFGRCDPAPTHRRSDSHARSVLRAQPRRYPAPVERAGCPTATFRPEPSSPQNSSRDEPRHPHAAALASRHEVRHPARRRPREPRRRRAPGIPPPSRAVTNLSTPHAAALPSRHEPQPLQ